MVKTIVAVLMAASLLLTPVGKTNAEKDKWEPVGKCRITCYCPICNDGEGYESASGKELRYGYAACSWLPIGTKISVEGEIFEIVDVCGTDAIDLFIDTDEPVCHCNLNEYRYVSVKRGGTNANTKSERNEKAATSTYHYKARWWRVSNQSARDRSGQVQNHDYKKKSESILRRAG